MLLNGICDKMDTNRDIYNCFGRFYYGLRIFTG